MEEVMFESSLHKEFVIQGRGQRPGGGRVVCVGGTNDMEGDNKILGWVQSLLTGVGCYPPAGRLFPIAELAALG